MDPRKKSAAHRCLEDSPESPSTDWSPVHDRRKLPKDGEKNNPEGLQEVHWCWLAVTGWWGEGSMTSR